MVKCGVGYKIAPEWREQDWIVEKALAALKAPVLHITDVRSSRSAGGIHDYYSNGDYWWPYDFFFFFFFYIFLFFY